MGRVEISRPGVQAVIGAHKLRQERCNKKRTWRHAGSRTFTNSTTTPRRIMRVVLDHYKVTKREESMEQYANTYGARGGVHYRKGRRRKPREQVPDKVRVSDYLGNKV